MKKIIKTILCTGLVLTICISFIACGNSASETSAEKETVSADNTSDTALPYNQDSEEFTEETSEESENEFITEEETSKEYYHAAISGAVIVEDFGDGYYSYREKCEYCDYVASGNHTRHSTMGTFTTTFQCPECGSLNNVEIETNSR